MRATKILSALFVTSVAVLTVGNAYAVTPFTETFDGAFDNTWETIGDGGTFLTNGFGEDVLALSSSGSGLNQNGIERVIGAGAFEAIVEISNPTVSPALSSVTFVVGDDGLDYAVLLGLLGASGGGMQLTFAYSNGDPLFPTFAAIANLGSSVDRLTLKLVHEPDLVNGGGIFEALYDVNESGTFTSMGSIDGTEYVTNAVATRALGMFTIASEPSAAAAELDFAQITAVPEPSTLILGCTAVVVMGIGGLRRRIRRAYRARAGS